MNEDRRTLIEQTLADLAAQGIPSPSTHQVHGLVGGNYPDLVRYLQERRARTTAESPQMAPASVAAQDEPAPSPAAVAVLEPSAPSADPERAERLAKYRAERLARLQAAPAPPAPAAPATRSVPYVPVQQSIYNTNSPPPVWYGGAPPPPDTRPKLVIAREAARRWQEQAREAERRAAPVAAQIAAFQARQTQLTAARKTVATVEELRTLKAELVEIDEELEILQRQHAPLVAVVRSLAKSTPEADAYSMLRGQAIEALERARTQHFHGTSEADKAKRFQALVDLVGAEDVKRYVTDLTEPSQCRLPQNNPPWK